MSRVKSWVVLALLCIFSSGLVWTNVGMAKIYENFDGPYYAIVAKSFYDKTIIGSNFEFSQPLEYYPAHFPFYPLVSQTLSSLTGLNILRSMLLVNITMAIIGCILIFESFTNLKWPQPFLSAVAWLFLWPRMWGVRSIASPETLFISLVIASLWMFEKKKYFISSLLGCLAILTKSPGILLFLAYSLWFVLEYIKTKKLNLKIWPIILMPITLILLFGFYYLRVGDFWAYFHSGDNIHLQLLPFRVFDSSQTWVGTFWLEDIIWIYLLGGLGVYYALKKSHVWGLFGGVFFTTILFVSHRDISRYALPIVPVVLLGLGHLFERKEIKITLAILAIPLFFYTVNFLKFNTISISNWTPFLTSSSR